MLNLITVDNNKYFKSKDIKVFPSSFRGTYKSGTSPLAADITFDPEARLNTEANFILPKNTLNTQGKDSYIIEYNTTKQKITFILGGYYFEILNINDYLDEILNKYIGITLRPIALQASSDFEGDQFKLDSDRTSNLLGSWIKNSGDVLDFLNTTDDLYCFTGLKVLESEDDISNCSAVLKLFTKAGEVNYEACLPNIKQGEGKNTLLHGEGLKAAYPNQTVVGKYNDNKADTLFEVGNGNNDSERSNAFEVCDDFTRINTNAVVNGLLVVRNHIATTGKITSEHTSSSDDSSTLVTKSYIDNMIGNISERPPTPPTSNVGDGDNYVASISQAGAQVSSVLKAFTGTITDTSTNAPTAAAVKNFVDTQITNLYVAEVGGSNTYIQKISETDGKISATSKSFSTSIDASSDDSTAPTAKAVYEYIKAITDDIGRNVTSEINNKVNDIKIETQVGGDGSYLKTIDQAGGKITPVSEEFDPIVTNNPNNAPTSAAVKTFTEDTVNSKVAGIWTDSFVKASSKAAASSLQSIVLNAAYPIGSVYICYSENKLTTCPIATSLGGTWTAIESGNFLVSASTSNGIYKYGNTGGNANATVIQHYHSFNNTITTSEAGAHSHTIKWFDTSAHDSRTDNTFRSADSGDSGGVKESKWPKIETTSDGAHTHTFKLSGNTAGVGSDGTNQNLPPYIAVYMWRRTK